MQSGPPGRIPSLPFALIYTLWTERLSVRNFKMVCTDKFDVLIGKFDVLIGL
jgi:hypothetical protein